jgi:hypothetical protein
MAKRPPGRQRPRRARHPRCFGNPLGQ